MLLENKILERKLQLVSQEYDSAKRVLTDTVSNKEAEIERFNARNKQLEDWCTETQAKLETEAQYREGLEARVTDMKEEYLRETSKNFQHLDDKITQFDQTSSRVAELERSISDYQRVLATVVETQNRDLLVDKHEDIQRLIDERVSVLTPKIPTPPPQQRHKLLVRLRDKTPIF